MKTLQLASNLESDSSLIKSSEIEIRLKQVALSILGIYLKTGQLTEAYFSQIKSSEIDLVTLSFTFSDLSYLCKEIAILLKDARFQQSETIEDFEQLLRQVQYRLK